MSEFIDERIRPDAAIERSIFRTDDPLAIWQSVREICPEAVDCFAFEASVGALFGLRLRDGSRVIVEERARFLHRRPDRDGQVVGVRVGA